MTITGLLQLQRSHVRHRHTGYIFAVCGLVASITGILLSLRYSNPAIVLTLLWGGIYVLYRTSRAIQYAIRRNIPKHIKEIVTLYGLITSALTVRIAIVLGPKQSYWTLACLWIVTICTLKATRYIASLIVGTKILTGFPVDTAERSR